MKIKSLKIVSFIIVLSILLVACGNNEGGTYYPDSKEMQNNLENKSYEVSVEEVKTDEYSGMHLIAAKGDEYIEFYWLDDGNGIDILTSDLEKKYDNYNSLVSMQEDSKFGSFVFCSTKTAKDDAGIRIVSVEVN